MQIAVEEAEADLLTAPRAWLLLDIFLPVIQMGAAAQLLILAVTLFTLLLLPVHSMRLWREVNH
jgi:hypothetical protein